MNKSQSNLVKQAEKIVVTYSRKKSAGENKKAYRFLISGIIFFVVTSIILIRMCI